MAWLKGHSNLSFQLQLCGCSQRAAEGGMCWCGPSPGVQAADEGCSALLPATVPVSRAGPGPPRDSVLSPAWLPQPPPAEELQPAPAAGSGCCRHPEPLPLSAAGEGATSPFISSTVREQQLCSPMSAGRMDQSRAY